MLILSVSVGELELGIPTIFPTKNIAFVDSIIFILKHSFDSESNQHIKKLQFGISENNQKYAVHMLMAYSKRLVTPVRKLEALDLYQLILMS